MEEEKLLTVAQAAERLGVGESAVRNAMYQSRLPFVDLYGKRLIRPSDLEAYRHRAQPGGVKRIGRPKVKQAPKDEQEQAAA